MERLKYRLTVNHKINAKKIVCNICTSYLFLVTYVLRLLSYHHIFALRIVDFKSNVMWICHVKVQSGDWILKNLVQAFENVIHYERR